MISDNNQPSVMPVVANYNAANDSVNLSWSSGSY